MQKYCEIPTSKGILRGYFHTPDKEKYPVCLIFHGFTGNHTGTKFAYVKISRLLEELGIGTLRMDFLGSGDSDLEFKDMTFDDELSCARIMLETVRNFEHALDIYILGHSMGGAIASELAKLYPDDIKKLCLWAPALNMPELFRELKKQLNTQEYYDYYGFEISDVFVEDLIKRDLFKDLDIYKNELMIIHGTDDHTVDFNISKKYLPLYNDPIFKPIKGGSHNYDSLKQINEVIQLTVDFMR